MGKIAFVFSGQGAQAPGMGLELYENSPAARAAFDALETIRPGTLDQCFRGSEAELQETANTQPCMVAMELAALAAMREAGITPDMAAGFSLGELSALCCGGAMDARTAFRLTCRRGELMQRAAEARNTGMAAVVKLTNEEVEKLCAGFRQVWPVNYNCPGQVTVSGAEEEMAGFAAAVKAAGGRAIPLKVRGGFHSPFMAEAGEAFRRELAKEALREPVIPVYANLTGEPYGADVIATLGQQMCSPVRWEASVRGMIAAGAGFFVELGPGKTLSGLIAKTDSNVPCFPVSQMKDIEALRKELAQC